MLRDSNHLSFMVTLLLATVYAACTVRTPTAPAPAPTIPVVTPAPELTRLPVKTPPVTVTLPFRPSPSPVTTQTQIKPTATADFDKWLETSPDGKWVASGQRLSAMNPCGIHTILKVTKAQGSKVWLAWEDDQPCALGTTNPKPLHWSKDGNFLYFTNVPIPDGCGELVNSSDLQRLNLQTGKVTQLMPGSGLAMALSPDETQVAYIAYYGRGLVIRELATGKERELKLPEGLGGSLVWAPDASALALTLDPRGCSNAYSVVWVDTQTFELKTLIDSDSRKFVTIDWKSGDAVTVMDKDQKVWQVDAETGEVSPV
jgi:hypothetical protein